MSSKNRGFIAFQLAKPFPDQQILYRVLYKPHKEERLKNIVGGRKDGPASNSINSLVSRKGQNQRSPAAKVVVVAKVVRNSRPRKVQQTGMRQRIINSK